MSGDTILGGGCMKRGGGGGRTRFDALDDTFTYPGNAGKVVVVNGTATGLTATAEGLIDDHKLLISGTDTTAGYLKTKLITASGSGITITEETPSGNADLKLSVNAGGATIYIADNLQLEVALNSLTDSQVNTICKDGLAAVYSMRTLGSGAQQAAAGNHNHGTGNANYVTMFTDAAGNIGNTRFQQLSNGLFVNNPSNHAEGYLSLGDNGYEKIWLSKEATTNDFLLTFSDGGGTPLRVRQLDGNLVYSKRIGIANVSLPSTSMLTEFLVVNFDDATNMRGINDWSCLNSEYGARVGLMKSRGTPTTPLTVQNADVIGRLIWKTYDGTTWLDAGCIRLEVNGTVATGITPSDMVFYTQSAAGSYRETLRLNAAGNLLLQQGASVYGERISTLRSQDDALVIYNSAAAAVVHFDFNPTSGYNNVRFNVGILANYGTLIQQQMNISMRNDSGSVIYGRKTDDSAAALLTLAASSIFILTGTTGSNNRLAITDSGVGLGSITSPTAVLHFPAGTATAGTAPLKLTSGSLLTVTEAGAFEFLTDALYFTITTGATRKRVQLQSVVVKTTGSPFTIDESYTTLVVNSATAYTVNLPAATGSFKIYDIKNINVGVVTVDANGTETIDGALVKSLGQYDNIRIQDYVSGGWVIL